MEEKRSAAKDLGRDKPKTYTQILEAKINTLMLEAKELCDEGQAGAAVRKLSRAIALEPNNPELFRHRAEALTLAGDYRTAAANFNKVISMREEAKAAMHKRLSVVYHKYGMVLVSQKKHEKAAEMFENATGYDSDNKEAVTRRMECLIAMQRYSECMTVIQKELAEDDTNPDLFIVRAQLFILFGKTSRGYYDVCKALELRSDHPEALEMKKDLEKKAQECKNQAVHKSLLGKQMDALRKLNNAIEIDPEVPEYLILRGTVCRKIGDFNAAMEDFLLAMDKCDHKEDSPIYLHASRQLLLTYNDFAMECFRQRQFDSAVTLLNKAIQQEKNEGGLYLNRGDCFYRLGNLNFALADYQQALELDPANWEVYCRVGVVCCEIGVELFGKGSYVEAEEKFSAAIQHNPKVSWFYLCRARAKYELKNISGCREDILFAMVLNPKSEECLSLLASVCAGKTKEEVLSGAEAIEAQVKLQAIFKLMAAKMLSQKANKPERRERGERADVHLDSLVLRVAVDEEEEKTRERKELHLESAKTEGVWGGGGVRSGGETRTGFTSLMSEEREEEEEAGGGKALRPRKWSVLTYPLPELTSDPHSILGILQESMREEKFHKSIFYSKKSCDLEFEEVLYSPPESYIRPPPPKLQELRDVVTGGRNVVSSNKSLKR